jgi:hypothetical protein
MDGATTAIPAAAAGEAGPAAPTWAGVVDAALVRRLHRPARRPGLVRHGQARALLARHRAVVPGVPLAEALLRRFPQPELRESPVVPARPVPVGSPGPVGPAPDDLVPIVRAARTDPSTAVGVRAAGPTARVASGRSPDGTIEHRTPSDPHRSHPGEDGRTVRPGEWPASDGPSGALPGPPPEVAGVAGRSTVTPSPTGPPPGATSAAPVPDPARLRPAQPATVTPLPATSMTTGATPVTAVRPAPAPPTVRTSDSGAPVQGRPEHVRPAPPAAPRTPSAGTGDSRPRPPAPPERTADACRVAAVPLVRPAHTTGPGPAVPAGPDNAGPGRPVTTDVLGEPGLPVVRPQPIRPPGPGPTGPDFPAPGPADRALADTVHRLVVRELARATPPTPALPAPVQAALPLPAPPPAIVGSVPAPRREPAPAVRADRVAAPPHRTPPPLDMGRLADAVSRRLANRGAAEAERRGMGRRGTGWR